MFLIFVHLHKNTYSTLQKLKQKKFTNIATGPKYKKFKEKIYTKIVAIHISLHDNIELIK